MKTIDREACRILRAEIIEALADVAERHGLSIDPGNARYSDTSVTFKLECAVLSENGQAMDRDAQTLIQYADIIPWLDESHLGAIVTIGGERFQLTGYSPRSRKFPFLALRVRDSRKMKLPSQAVQTALPLADKETNR